MTKKLKRGITSSLTLALCAALAATAPGCSKKGDGVGADCNPDKDSPCDDGLECTASGDGHVCTYPLGSGCDPNDDDLKRGGCGPDAACEEVVMMSGAGGAGDGEYICVGTEGAACDPEEPYCSADLSCAETTSGDHYCFGKVLLRGQVTDTSDAAPIAGAHVLSLNELRFAVTDIAESAEDGTYELEIPVVRDEEGNPTDQKFTLNGSAQNYQPFPAGVRVALPILASDATRDGSFYVVQSALTDIGLIPLPDGERYIASGMVSGLAEDSLVGGVLVVATSGDSSYTAISDQSGNFTLFNLPDGTYELKAYGAGIQIGSESITVSGGNIEKVVLSEVDEATTTVSGTVQIVNAPGGSLTSVILVVADTFDELAARGEVPRGLRAPESGPVNVTGEFTIENVPAGEYVVLAAYENDDLVRDPDTNISGTSFVYLTVDAGQADFSISDSFKVTEALAIISPGVDGPEAVTGKPLLEWADDSSEDWYDLRVYDAFGEEVWNSLQIPGVSGSDTVTAQYDGPLEPGMYYQFRVTSWRQPGGGTPAPISATEDLRGVFYLPAQ